LNSTYERLTFRNIGYNSIAKMLMYLFAAVSNVVLGRCLAAGDYGIVSFAFIFINFMANFADFGIGNAVIQRKEIDSAALYTAFTLKFLIGCVVVALTFIISSLAPIFFDNPQVVVVIRLLSLYFLISNISFLPSTMLMREMNFKMISIAEIVLSFLNSLVAIILALKGYGYWSIVAAYLMANLVSAVMLAVFRPVAVRFRLHKEIVREYVNFGGYLFLSGLLVFLIFNLDNFIIGAVNGSRDLGYYAIAYNWGSMICIVMYMVVLRVVFPLMAKLQGEDGQIRNAYLKTLEYSGYLVVMANFVLFAVSREFLVCILGRNTDKWLPALVSLRILCVYGVLRGLLEPVGQVIMAQGKTKTLLSANLLASVIEAAAVYPALRFGGIEGVALVVTIAYLSQYMIFYQYLKRQLQIGLKDLVRAVRPSLCACLPILLLYLFMSQYNVATLPMLFGKAFFLMVVYVLTLGVVTDWELLRTIETVVAKAKRAV